MTVARTLQVARLGVVEYQDAWELQRRMALLRRHELIPDTLLLLEHPHTYTLGRRGKLDHILLTPCQLAGRKIEVHEVDRGGDATYHGPGQLVGYPILKLEPGRMTFVHYIRRLEAALLQAVRDLGIAAGLQEGYSGVWIGDEKVCAIGVKVDARGITSHGFALNVNTDLSYFGHIIPCGITDKGVTSLQRELGRQVSMRRVQDAVARCIGETFELQVQVRSAGPRTLESKLARADARLLETATGLR
ncbi:MAG: lipoyl(octanoyl) transferase LipB [Pseudomonadota bacterium]|nr:lipoyl(octanoyl) transferase LipB [Pseudomonadota bacterium]